jgi:hypothetical protein
MDYELYRLKLDNNGFSSIREFLFGSLAPALEELNGIQGETVPLELPPIGQGVGSIPMGDCLLVCAFDISQYEWVMEVRRGIKKAV